MKPQTRSILEELNDIADVRNTESLIESRAMNVITSAINLLESIRKHYDADTALELERRLVNSIKGSDPAKFTRGIRKIAESRKAKRKLD
jgi:glucose-6-phosphate-specific signal transduction histidine kinase